MRWETPKNGDKKIIKKFLFLPLEIRNDVRWLEFATIGQEYNGWHKCWENKEWLYI